MKKESKYLFAALVCCFALWGVLNNMTDNLVPAFQRIFTMDQTKAGLVQVSFYGAYAILAIFAAVLAEELSYRKGVLIGLGIYILGALLYIPACIAQSFDIYFVAIFIVAGGCSLLETTCNPYVLSLGEKETAVRRLNFAQMFNPVGSITGILLAKQLILSHLNPATAEERAQMDPETLKGIINHELFWVCAPYIGLCAIAAAIWIFFSMSQDDGSKVGQRTFARVFAAMAFSLVPLVLLYPCIPYFNGIWEGNGEILWVLVGLAGPFAYVLCVKDYRDMLKTLLRTPRYWFGVIAQFFYVGVQIAAWTWLNVYCQKELGVSPATAAIYYIVAIALFTAARWVATFMMKYVNPAPLMAVFAFGAILSSLGVMYLKSDVVFTVGPWAFSWNFFGYELGFTLLESPLPFSWNIVCLVLMSGFMSLMFPTIYGIALGDLDRKSVKLGASGLIMSILGGAIITPWMAGIIGNKDSFWSRLVSGFGTEWDPDLKLTQTSLRASFFVPVICFAVVLVYSLVFIRRKPSKSE